jgi:hypothetical protein
MPPRNGVRCANIETPITKPAIIELFKPLTYESAKATAGVTTIIAKLVGLGLGTSQDKYNTENATATGLSPKSLKPKKYIMTKPAKRATRGNTRTLEVRTLTPKTRLKKAIDACMTQGYASNSPK